MIDDDVQHTLVRSPLFRGVSPVLVSATAARSESRLLSPREKLLSAGSQNQRLYVVLSGTVSVGCLAPMSLT
jgi:CRP-like cAMP-binding protein